MSRTPAPSDTGTSTTSLKPSSQTLIWKMIRSRISTAFGISTGSLIRSSVAAWGGAMQAPAHPAIRRRRCEARRGPGQGQADDPTATFLGPERRGLAMRRAAGVPSDGREDDVASTAGPCGSGVPDSRPQAHVRAIPPLCFGTGPHRGVRRGRSADPDSRGRNHGLAGQGLPGRTARAAGRAVHFDLSAYTPASSGEPAGSDPVSESGQAGGGDAPGDAVVPGGGRAPGAVPGAGGSSVFLGAHVRRPGRARRARVLPGVPATAAGPG